MLSVDIKGLLKAPLTGGKLEVSVTFNHLPLLHTTTELCPLLDSATGHRDSCPMLPVPTPELEIKIQQKIPAYAPVGNYQGFLLAKDDSGKLITCLAFNFHMNRGGHRF